MRPLPAASDAPCLICAPRTTICRSEPPLTTANSQFRCAAQKTGVDVAAAASALQLELVESFLLATERGDAETLMTMCTDDFLYKTHRATTTTLADAEERFHTKVPPPTKVTTPLGAGAEPDTFERVINVKPVPFVNVNVHQLFTVRGNKLARAEYIKL